MRLGSSSAPSLSLRWHSPCCDEHGFRLLINLKRLWTPEVRRVLALMIPGAIGLGIVNFGLVVNSIVGSMVDAGAPRAIDAAYRIYSLPHAMLGVAVAIVIFPTFSRLVSRGEISEFGALLMSAIRQLLLFLIPMGALLAVLAEPITRLVYERGAFDTASTALVAPALAWFGAVLPFGGVNVILTRALFALQRPWATTLIALVSLAVTIAVDLAVYRTLGVAGIVMGTAAGAAIMMGAQLQHLHRLVGLSNISNTAFASARFVAVSAGASAIAYVAWADPRRAARPLAASTGRKRHPGSGRRTGELRCLPARSSRP